MTSGGNQGDNSSSEMLPARLLTDRRDWEEESLTTPLASPSAAASQGRAGGTITGGQVPLTAGSGSISSPSGGRVSLVPFNGCDETLASRMGRVDPAAAASSSCADDDDDNLGTSSF